MTTTVMVCNDRGFKDQGYHETERKCVKLLKKLITEKDLARVIMIKRLRTVVVKTDAAGGLNEVADRLFGELDAKLRKSSVWVTDAGRIRRALKGRGISQDSGDSARLQRSSSRPSRTR